MQTASDNYSRESEPLSRTASSSVVLGGVALGALYVPSAAVPIGFLAAALGLRGLFESSTGLRRGSFLAKTGIALGVVAAISSFLWSAQRKGEVNLAGLGQAYFRRDIIETMWPAFVKGAVKTVEFAALSEVLGVVLGLVLAVFVLSQSRAASVPAKAYIDFFRGTPLLMQLLVISFGLPFIGIRLDPFPAGVIGLTLNSSAYVAEIFRAGIQSIERGQMDAARSLGMPRATAMLYVIIPQAVRRVIPPLMNEFIALVKDSSLVAVLGATIAGRELLRVARDGAAYFVSATPYVMASISYLLLTIPLTRIVGRLETRLRSSQV